MQKFWHDATIATDCEKCEDASHSFAKDASSRKKGEGGLYVVTCISFRALPANEVDSNVIIRIQNIPLTDKRK